MSETELYIIIIIIIIIIIAVSIIYIYIYIIVLSHTSVLVMQDYYSADDFFTSEIQQHDYFL